MTSTVMTVTPSLRWQIPAGVSGALLVVAGGFVPLPVAVSLAALGGALVAAAILPAVVPAGSARSTEGERLEAMANAFQEGMLDLYSLYEVGRTISASLHLDQLLTTTMKRVAQTTGIESYALFLLDDDQSKLVAKSVGGAVAEGLQQMALSPGDGLSGQVCRTRVPEMHTGPMPVPWPDVPGLARSVIGVPLVGRDRLLGALLLYSVSPSAFSERELAYFTAIGKQLSIALDNATIHRRATELSYHDALTGLFNRRYLEEALETEIRRASRYDLPFSLNMVDIDHFKRYNDAHGHTRGDDALRVVARRLREQTRNADIVTRYGGEEFLIILPMTTKPHARLVAEKLRSAIASTVIDGGAGGPEISLTISVGVATFPNDSSTATGLLQAADAALYAAKDRGRNRIEAFNDEQS
jgi:diguanylate cyclase (GGDEF)-like protein